MQRRNFSLGLGSLGALTYLLSNPSIAQSASKLNLEAGKNYHVLNTQAPSTIAAGKVEIIEFFGYWCPHCSALEPKLQQWEKSLPPFIELTRVPVSFGAGRGASYQKLYYSLLQMGLWSHKLHDKVFYTLHIERKALDTDAAVIAWAQSQGINKEKFTQVLQSFGVQSKVRQAVQLTQLYGVESVPSMGVAGKYYTDAQMAGGTSAMLKAAQALATEVHNA